MEAVRKKFPAQTRLVERVGAEDGRYGPREDWKKHHGESACWRLLTKKKNRAGPSRVGRTNPVAGGSPVAPALGTQQTPPKQRRPGPSRPLQPGHRSLALEQSLVPGRLPWSSPRPSRRRLPPGMPCPVLRSRALRRQPRRSGRKRRTAPAGSRPLRLGALPRLERSISRQRWPLPHPPPCPLRPLSI